jgi:drug/metabolite transporter (DMT)-like permease
MTTTFAWVLMFAGFLASAASQIIIKARLDPVTAAGGSYRQLITDPLMWLAILLIIGFVVCWYTALTRIPLSVMMAWSAVVLPLIAVGAWIWLGEPLGVGKMVSIGVIAAGVAMLSIF